MVIFPIFLVIVSLIVILIYANIILEDYCVNLYCVDEHDNLLSQLWLGISDIAVGETKEIEHEVDCLVAYSYDYSFYGAIPNGVG